MANYEERKCWSHFKERLAGEIRQYCTYELKNPNILDPEDAVNNFYNEYKNIIKLTKETKSEYKVSMKSDLSILVVSAGIFLRSAAGGGAGGAVVGAVGGGGAGAGIGALIGIIGGPIGVGIGAAIGAGVGATMGGAAGTIPGAGIGGWMAKKFRKDIVIPMQALLPRIGEVESDSKTGEMTVKVKLPSTYRPRQK